MWVRTAFDAAIAPGPKDFDFNLQQYTITEERQQAVDFSEGYYNACRRPCSAWPTPPPPVPPRWPTSRR